MHGEPVHSGRHGAAPGTILSHFRCEVSMSNSAQHNLKEHHLKERVVDSAKHFAVIFLYLWVLLAIFALHKTLILADQPIIYRQGFALLNALVLAKVMFLGEELGFAEGFRREPLIYSMIFKSAIFAVLLIVFDLMEGIVVGHFHGQSISKSISDVGGGTLVGIFSTTVIMFVVLIPFFGFRELCDVIGEPELHEVLFVKRAKFSKVSVS